MRQESGPFSRPRAAGQRNVLSSGKIPAQISSPLAACLGHTASFSPARFPKPLRWPKRHGHPCPGLCPSSAQRRKVECGVVCVHNLCVCERERRREGWTDYVISALGMECIYLGLSFHLCEMGIILVPHPWVFVRMGCSVDGEAVRKEAHRKQCCGSIITCTFICVSPECWCVSPAPPSPPSPHPPVPHVPATWCVQELRMAQSLSSGGPAPHRLSSVEHHCARHFMHFSSLNPDNSSARSSLLCLR